MLKSMKWICSDIKDTDKSVYFRKTFKINHDIKSAKLLICALGLGVYTINGKEVTDDVFCTPYTRFDKRVIFNEYDVTKLIKQGENALGVHVGNGFYNNNMKTWNDDKASWRDVPKLAARLNLVYENGETEDISTDLTWKSKEGNRLYNHMRQGEICDNSLTQYGFDTIDFCDKDWKNVVSAREPGGISEMTDMPPVRVIRKLKHVFSENGFYDFGENISGRVRIKASGEKGQQMRIIYDEAINADGKALGDIKYIARCEEARLTHDDIFIFSGEGKEEFAPCFCYHGFRYVWLENAPDGIEIEAEVIHTDLKQVGDFSCSCEILNKLHEMSKRSTLTNYFGIPTDCPHREQNGWTADAHLSSDQAYMNFDMSRSYRKWMNDFLDSQRPSGQLPGVVPSADWGYNWGSGPAWDSAVIIIPWNEYIYTGNTDLLAKMWDSMALYVRYMERMSEAYIANFGLGDWCFPMSSKMCPVEVTNTAYFYWDAVTMSKMAYILGYDSSEWVSLAEKVRNAWREKFLNNTELFKYQTFFACAVYHGLLNDDEIQGACNSLNELIKNNGYHIDCGILGTKYVFTVLSENGYIDTVYKMVTNPECPSYAHWIKRGMTTFCERWEVEPSSRNHHMFSEVDNWFYRYIGGIKFTENGLFIKPIEVSCIDEFYAEHRGISVKREKNIITVALDRDAVIEIANKKIKAEPGEYRFQL